MSSQFTTQSMSDYLSALASAQSSVSEQSMEDQEIIDSQKELLAEQKQRGIEYLSSASLPLAHLSYNIGSKVKTLAQRAMDFKDKVENVSSQLEEAPDSLEKIGKTIANKVSNIGEDAVSKLKNTASEKMSGLVDEARGQGASLVDEAPSTLSSLFENSRLGNMYKRFKQVMTPGEQQAQQMQEQAFEQDPEAGIREAQPEPEPEPVKPEPIPEATPIPEETVEAVAKPSLVEAGETTVKDMGSAVTDVGETATKAVSDAGAEAIGEATASLIPGVGEAVDAGLLLWQGIEGLKDLFHHPSQPPPPPIVNQAQPTFQAGI